MVTALKQLLPVLAVVCLAATSLVPSSAAAGNDQRHEVRAELFGPGLASGHVDYRDRVRNSVFEQRFSVSVEDVAPSSGLPIFINDVRFGTIYTNAIGRGDFDFVTLQPVGPGGGMPTDPDLPRIEAGDMAAVGELTGTFVAD